MSNKRRHDKATGYRALQDNGVDVSKHNEVRFNSGSETWRHFVGKSAVAYVARRYGYWVSSEVEVPEGEIDCLLWGQPDHPVWAVELETNPDEATKKDKLKRYVLEQPGIDDMRLLDVDALPDEHSALIDHVSDKLNLAHHD